MNQHDTYSVSIIVFSLAVLLVNLSMRLKSCFMKALVVRTLFSCNLYRNNIFRWNSAIVHCRIRCIRAIGSTWKKNMSRTLGVWRWIEYLTGFNYWAPLHIDRVPTDLRIVPSRPNDYDKKFQYYEPVR